MLSGPRTESALPVCSQVEVAASQVGQGRWWCSQGSRAWGAVGACLSGSLPGTTARCPPCACLPSSGRGSCVCALGCIHELLSHQDPLASLSSHGSPLLFPKRAKNIPAFQPGQRPFSLPSFIPVPYDELPYLFQICVQKSLSQANQTRSHTKKRPFFVSQLVADTQISPQPKHSTQCLNP